MRGNACLAKPFLPEELLSHIQQALNKTLPVQDLPDTFVYLPSTHA
ncbi:hypothetical protein [Pseudomonas sp. IT-347P]